MRRARIRKWVVRPILVLLLGALGYLGWNLATANFATVEAGRIYRSGQMRAGSMVQVIRSRGIRTVLNLRGSNPQKAWYRAERAAVLAEGATQVDIALSSSEWMSRAQLRTLLRVLDTCEYPLLIHCWRGSERTGLVSAMTELLRPGGTLDDARGQFSLRYLFVRAGDGAMMREHLDRYERWLRDRGQDHSPGRFRLWVAEGYRPGTPCREQWPYDPYPLVVISRPSQHSGPLAGGKPAPRQ